MKRVTTAALVLATVACRPSGPASPVPVRVAYPSLVATLDPIHENSVISNSVYCNIFEPLVMRDASLMIVPGLAVKWSNPDERSWVFTLRPGVRFHDGTPVEAEDVRFSLERARNEPGSLLSPSLAMLDRAEVVDARTVKVVTRRPYSILLSRLVDIWIVPRKAFLPAESGLKPPPGTGPYRVSAWTPRSSVFLEANRGYWGGAPAVERVELSAIPDPRERLRALEQGRIDLIPLVEPALAASVRRSHPSYRFTSAPGLLTLFLGMDVSRQKTPYAEGPGNPFRDRRVRRAVYEAIRIDHIVHDILQGDALPATQIVAPKVFGFDPEIRRLAFDPDDARKLLAEAGYPHGFRVRLDYSQDRYRSDREVGEAIASDLESVGLHVDRYPAPQATFFPRRQARNTSLFLMGWSLPSGDASGALDFCLHSPDPGRGYGVENAGGYSNREVDRLTEESAEELVPSSRVVLLRRAMAIAMEDIAAVPLYIENRLSASSVRIRWEVRPDEFLYLKTLQVARPE